MTATDDYKQERDLAKRLRAHALRMTAAAKASHIGSCLSIADLLSVLFTRFLRVDPNQPKWPERDRFILSKGHAAAVHYAALAERGFFPVEELATYCQEGSRLGGHSCHRVPGVEISTGSLGHGLPVATGMALAGRRGSRDFRVVALLSDGECDEGSTWEAALFAPQHHLDNLVVIVDSNHIQSFGRVADVLDLEPQEEKWRSFRWRARVVDGHNLAEISAALADVPFERGWPSVVIAETIKGKGVSFMEDRLEWHYRSADEGQLAAALAEVESSS